MENGEYEKDLQDLKKMLLELSKPELKEIKAKFKKVKKRKEEIDNFINCIISTEIFENDLDDKELDIFLDTYYYILYYAPAIDEVLSELYSKIEN